MNKLLFLDRDGVINIDYGHVYKIEDFHFNEDIFAFCKYYLKEGFKIVVVTNQAGIAKGLYKEEDYKIVNEYMLSEFKKRDIVISDVLYCPHHPDDLCDCRKPAPGLIIDAISKYYANPALCVLIGDKMSDIVAGHLANVHNLYFLKGKYEPKPTLFTYTIINKLTEAI